jgi:hypothetical protein
VNDQSRAKAGLTIHTGAQYKNNANGRNMEKIDETVNSDCSQSETDNSPTKCLNSPTTVLDSQNKMGYNLKELDFQLQLHEMKTKDINQDSTSDQDDMTPKANQEQTA